MKARWKAWNARFALLKQREKYLVSGAVLVAILLGGNSLWLEPAQLRKAMLEKQIAQDKADTAELTVQVAALQTQLKEPDAANRAAIADARQRLSETNGQLKEFDQVLVAPEQMPNLLRALLARHRGLELVSLKTLDPVPVIQHPADKTAAKPLDANKAAAADQGNIYQHGIVIKVAGSYQDLLNYVAEMETSAQRLLLGRMNLAVSKYPRVELTLTVYSLSLDRTWLVI